MAETPRKPRKPARKPATAPVAVAEVARPDFASKLRERSVGGLSDLLGIDRSTINKWVKKHGCPVVRESAGRGAGNEWKLDVAAVFAWHAKWQREQLLEATAGGEGDDPDADLKLFKLAEMAKLLVPVDEVVAMQARVYSQMRQTVMAMPSLIGRGFPGFPKERVNAAVDRADDLVGQALETFAKIQASAVPEQSDSIRIVDDAAQPPQE
ncbi:protein of unknown function [Beijerinckiaceae bacterium RH AL1]|nr:protein of unknown function [Beijerinckiaceae bacterium RH CH11]VVB44586.1 protein of unknown function [Beijerinckiaceae bacterium RH AL8]VVC54391.1 protein of unknown function [Beijerinckiaceae bacterium RH AL1]